MVSRAVCIAYIGVVKALRRALADYTSGGGGRPGDDPTPDKAELIAKIIGIIKEIEVYMSGHGFSLKALVDADDFSKLALVSAGANAMCTTDEIKKRFEIQARELFRMFKYIEKGELTAETWEYKNAISAIYEQLQQKEDDFGFLSEKQIWKYTEYFRMGF